MNERIRELALDAGLLNYVDHETPRRYFVHGHAEQEDVEKFAELIVRECANLFEVEYGESVASGNEVARVMKRHFGVK